MDVASYSTSSALAQAQAQAQVKVQKGALKQQEAVVMKLLDCATCGNAAPKPTADTGSKLDVVA